jgi:hypothetical protein
MKFERYLTEFVKKYVGFKFKNIKYSNNKNLKLCLKEPITLNSLSSARTCCTGHNTEGMT